MCQRELRSSLKAPAGPLSATGALILLAAHFCSPAFEA